MSKGENPLKNAVISPPRWMTRSEKAQFRSVLEAREALANPVVAAERDMLVDYVSVRSRIDALRRLFKKEYADMGGSIPSQRHVAGLARQIDASTGLARRLAKDLKLLEQRLENADDE